MDRAAPETDLARLADGIDPAVLAQLEAVPLAPGRPLLVVDCDEVLVEFAAHLARFADGVGVEMRLERYELEGAFRDRASGRVLPFAEAIGLIDRFFREECLAQRAIEGAAAALARLSEIAQVVVLTNVPRHAREDRIENLAALGMPYPLVENAGGKGRALAWLAAKAGVGPGTPGVFVDDSPSQIASAARRAAGLSRVQFRGSDYVRDVLPRALEAEAEPASWAEAERTLRRLLA